MKAVSSKVPMAILALSVALFLVPAREGLADTSDESSPEAEAKALVQTLRDLQQTQDSAKLRTALDQLVKLHNEITAKSVRSALQAAAGKVLSDKELGADRVAAAEALGKLDDPSGAYKRLKRSLPTSKTEEAEPAELAALQAVGTLAPDAAIKLLLDLMTKAKDNNVAREAVVALGSYGSSKKRVAVLQEVVKYMQRAKPSRSPDKAVGAATQARWDALGTAMLASLNRMTNQRVNSVDEWIQLYKDMKRNPKAIFLDDD